MDANNPQSFSGTPTQISRKNSKNKKFLFWITGVVVGIIAVVGLLLWQTQKQDMSLEPTKNTEQQESVEQQGQQEPVVAGEEIDTSTWQTYRNDEFGFELKYPSAWSVAEADSRNRVGFAEKKLTVNELGIEQHLGGMFVNFYSNTCELMGNEQRCLPFEEWLEWYVDFTNLTLTIRDMEAKAGTFGTEGYEGFLVTAYRVPDKQIVATVYFERDGVVYEIRPKVSPERPYQGEVEKIFDQVLSTFRFVETEAQEDVPASSGGEPAIRLISPNGGETWTIGEETTIRWEAQNAPADSYVRLDIGGSRGRVAVLRGVSSKDGMAAVEVPISTCAAEPIDICLNVPPADDYVATITLYTGPPNYCVHLCPSPNVPPVVFHASDTSDATFRVLPGPPTISRVSPSQGNVGAEVTVSGWGFSKTGNKVRFNDQEVATVNSPDGTTLVFTVPDSIASGYYRISVMNANGVKNVGHGVPSFTVNSS